RRIAVAVLLILVLIVIWTVAGFLSFRSGVSSANKRLERMAPTVAGTLSHQNGAIISHPTTILLLGTDHMNNDQRVYDFHSDSIMLLRTHPGKHPLPDPSLPPDLRGHIPRHGPAQIHCPLQLRGAA